MFGISLTKILQEASITTPSGKQRYFSGGIESLQTLLRPENQAALQRLHDGLYCFLVFHPNADHFISEYVENGSLASDSGKEIMVLFIAAREMRTPQRIQINDLGIQLDNEIHPAYDAVSLLFPGKKVQLPGIVFFDNFIKPKESVYIPIEKTESLEVTTSIFRKVFVIAQKSYQFSKSEGIDFENHFAIQLGKNHVDYKRTGRTSLGEWLIKAYNIICENKSDIIAGLGLLK